MGMNRRTKTLILISIILAANFLALDSSTLWESSVIIGKPVKVIVNEHGVFIGDMKQVKIFHLDFNGKLISELGEPGEGPNEFTSLQDFVIHNNQIYVKSNSRIKCLNLKGEFIKKWDFTMKYTFHHFFVSESGFILVGKLFEKDSKLYSKSETAPYNFFHHISFNGELIKSFGTSFPELEKINIWNNLLFLAGMNPSHKDNYIYYGNHLNYQIWRASIDSGKCFKLIDEKVSYYIPFLSKLNQYTSEGGTITKGDMQGTYMKFFKNDGTLIVFLKSGSWSKGYKSTYLRIYRNDKNEFKFIRDLKLENGLNLFSYYKDTFYGFSDEGNFVAFKFDLGTN